MDRKQIFSDGEFSENGSGSEVDDGDVEFLNSLEEDGTPGFLTGANGTLPGERTEKNGVDANLAKMSECPESQKDLIEATSGVAILDLPSFVRIYPNQSQIVAS